MVKGSNLSARLITGSWLLWQLTLLGVVGCAGDDSADEAEARKPDTGYGKGQPAPTVRTCTEFCARIGDCAAALCNEDTKSTRYDALEDALVFQCEGMCDESELNTQITETQWQCLFVDSCRQAIDYDDCHAGASYFCN